MTDKELLEAAAKAAGMDVIGYQEEGDKVPAHLHVQEDGWSFGWNPLIYDGDALRLAVKLGLEVKIKPCSTVCWYCVSQGVQIHNKDWGDNPYAAARRAIVRAAAAMGVLNDE